MKTNIHISKGNSHLNYNDSEWPVIKINFKGDILYANMSSFDLLLKLGCYLSGRLPAEVISQLKDNTKKQLQIMKFNMHSKKCNFLVVPFPEAGYIGIYGFDFTSKKINN